ICCTSREDRYLNTSPAASSPSDITRTAQRSRSESAIAIFLFHPRAQDHGDRTWVFLCHGASGIQVFFVAAHFRGATLSCQGGFTIEFFQLGFRLTLELVFFVVRQ